MHKPPSQNLKKKISLSKTDLESVEKCPTRSFSSSSAVYAFDTGARSTGSITGSSLLEVQAKFEEWSGLGKYEVSLLQNSQAMNLRTFRERTASFIQKSGNIR